MKNIITISSIFIVLFSCKQNESTKNETIENKVLNKPLKITLENLNQLKISDYYHNEILNPFPVHFKGFELSGQNRYMVNYGDEDNPNIMKLYKMFGYEKITTMYEFTNLKKDTIYYFPLTDKEYSKNQFAKLYQKNTSKKILDIYGTLYYKKDLGKIIVIDSIK